MDSTTLYNQYISVSGHFCAVLQGLPGIRILPQPYTATEIPVIRPFFQFTAM